MDVAYWYRYVERRYHLHLGLPDKHYIYRSLRQAQGNSRDAFIDALFAYAFPILAPASPRLASELVERRKRERDPVVRRIHAHLHAHRN